MQRPKETSENDGKFQISIEPQREKNDEKGKKCDCGKDMIEEVFHDNVKEHVKFDSFDLIRLIGKGSFGQVFMVISMKFFNEFPLFSIFRLKKARKKNDGKIFAMKALKKRTLIMKKQLRYAISEANVLKMSNHPFVLGLHYAFQVFYQLIFFLLFLYFFFNFSDKRKPVFCDGLLSRRRSFVPFSTKDHL